MGRGAPYCYETACVRTRAGRVHKMSLHNEIYTHLVLGGRTLHTLDDNITGWGSARINSAANTFWALSSVQATARRQLDHRVTVSLLCSLPAQAMVFCSFVLFFSGTAMNFKVFSMNLNFPKVLYFLEFFKSWVGHALEETKHDEEFWFLCRWHWVD